MVKMNYNMATQSMPLNNYNNIFNPYIAIDKFVKANPFNGMKVSLDSSQSNQLQLKLQQYYNKLKNNYGYIV